MRARFRFFYKRILEILWVKPLLVCLLSIAAAVLAKRMDQLHLDEVMPTIAPESIETLLQISASSMLVIATFAVGSMISAFSSAANAATPRTFSLLVSDDISQNALSVFIGAFIFSTITLVAVQNGYYGKAGYISVFLIVLFVFTIVIVTFVRWVDRIARLGRLGHAVDRVEEATRDALMERKRAPNLGGICATVNEEGKPVFGVEIGYVQRVDVPTLQTIAERFDCSITVASLPGAFATPDRPLARVHSGPEFGEDAVNEIRAAFTIGDARTFDEDPRFGLVVLSEIASKAMSPGINDSGTAIDVIGTLVRLFAFYAEPLPTEQIDKVSCNHVSVPGITTEDMFDDAFLALARDAAGTVEVGIRLQKALSTLVTFELLEVAARRHSVMALARAKGALDLPADYAALERAAPID